MSKNYIKAGIIVIVIIGIYFGLMYFVFGKNNEQKPDNPTQPSNPISTKYLVKDINNIWTYNGRWSTASAFAIEDKTLNVYIDRKMFGSYTLKEGAVWNLFDADNKYIPYTGDFYASSQDLPLTFPNYKEGVISVEEVEEIQTIIHKEISVVELESSKVIYIDLDENNMLDKIVLASNFNYIYADKEYYSVVYVNLNGEINPIINEIISNNALTDYPKYKDIDVINLNNSSVHNIVIKKEYFSLTNPNSYDIYTYNNNEYKKLI